VHTMQAFLFASAVALFGSALFIAAAEGMLRVRHARHGCALADVAADKKDWCGAGQCVDAGQAIIADASPCKPFVDAAGQDAAGGALLLPARSGPHLQGLPLNFTGDAVINATPDTQLAQDVASRPQPSPACAP